MAHVNLVFDRALHAQSAAHGEEGKLPYHLAVPLILAISAGLWIGMWKLGSLAIGLIG